MSEITFRKLAFEIEGDRTHAEVLWDTDDAKLTGTGATKTFDPCRPVAEIMKEINLGILTDESWTIIRPEKSPYQKEIDAIMDRVMAGPATDEDPAEFFAKQRQELCESARKHFGSDFVEDTFENAPSGKSDQPNLPTINPLSGWVQFHFESNRYFGHISDMADWKGLRAAFPEKSDAQLLQAREETNHGTRPKDQRNQYPRFGFRHENDGDRTLGDFFEEHGMKIE